MRSDLLVAMGEKARRIDADNQCRRGWELARQRLVIGRDSSKRG
jgi:hypothetical protein